MKKVKPIGTYLKILRFYCCAIGLYLIVDIRTKPIRNLCELLLVAGMLIYAMCGNSWTYFWIALGYVAIAKTMRIVCNYIIDRKKNSENESDEPKEE